jgi:hypothetical protein
VDTSSAHKKKIGLQSTTPTPFRAANWLRSKDRKAAEVYGRQWKSLEARVGIELTGYPIEVATVLLFALAAIPGSVPG